MRIAILALMMLFSLSACVRNKLTDWDKPGLTMAEFYADSTACQRETSGALLLGGPTYNRCMEARGYMRLFSGPLNFD
jgi:hypothetical protein